LEVLRAMRGLAASPILVTVWLVTSLWTIRPVQGQNRPLAAIMIDYPQAGSIFPPDMAAPTFLWRDPSGSATTWRIDVAFADNAPAAHATSRGERLRIGAIDPRCVAPTNKPPELTPEQATAHTWKPDAETWETIKRHSVRQAAAVTITGFRDNQAVSRGAAAILTSMDPVGAPIFYRDVPLMPSELEKGVIKPLAPKLLPFIAWRLRYVGEPSSRVVMEGIHTCANCHSFSRDGKTLGMDLDGPHNDKALYAIVPVKQQMSIRNEDVISWRTFRDQTAKDKRIGFMSQVSPDGQYIVTATQVEYYVANFKDYRFLQVFYPTRGILAWYSRADGRMRALPGADDPRYVHANAVWSPDGSYLVFARAAAKDSYPEGQKLAESANDPNEVQIQYDLYRIPFNNGKGGQATPIVGASRNGMSNSFPKISPDGRWIVFVQCRNGQLMRPDGRLYIVPATGGRARRMRCNTPLMNSWHSFSPNGRRMVFSSKSRSPYTQMFLTHIDEEGNDSPAILIENSTAANRAVNIPEFVNIPQNGLLHIDAPATEFYRLYDLAFELTEKGQLEAALAEWTKALRLDPDDANAQNNFGALLLRQGELDDAVAHLQKAIELKPNLTNAHDNLGLVLLQKGKVDEAIGHWRKALEIDPRSTGAHLNLGGAFLVRHQFKQAIGEWQEALRLEPNHVPALRNVAWMLATCPDPRIRNGAQAVELAERAATLTGGDDPVILDTLGAAYAEAGRFAEAVESVRKALAIAERRGERPLAQVLRTRIALYEARKAFRETE
jgi:tetratricopeptide (TPR) repeat protein